MKLTPLDIRHQEFKRGMRGYADVEVDEFLDQVADEFERVFKDNIDLGERVEALESQVTGYKRIEETLQKTLVSAQASADELRQNSAKEAQLILHEAELKGRQLVNEAYSERQSIEQSLAKLRSSEQDFRFKFRQLLEGYLKHLEEAPAGVAWRRRHGAGGVRASRRSHQGGHRPRGDTAAGGVSAHVQRAGSIHGGTRGYCRGAGSGDRRGCRARGSRRGRNRRST